MKFEKDNTANMAIGFVVREIEIEKFLDDMWVYINNKMLEDQNGAKE